MGWLLWTKERGRVRVIDLRTVIWVGAERDYVRFHQAHQSPLLRKTMNTAERESPACHFLRIHRSALVNPSFIREIQPIPGGDCRVFLKEGTVLTLSRVFRRRLSRGQPGMKPPVQAALSSASGAIP